MPDSLAGKVAIITGAGGAIGAAIAQRLCEAGARVMIADDNDTKLHVTLEVLKAQEGQAAKFATKLEDKLGASNLLAATIDTYGRVDVLVNIPRATQPGAFADLNGPAMTEALRLNVVSSLMLGQAVTRRMLEQREREEDFEGAILNVSSIAARRTVPELLAYSVSCAALDQLTRSMAAELATDRIRVNGIALGAVMTERMRATLRERADLRAELVRVTPLGRIGEAEEAAEAALFLVSHRASFVTGQILTVDGGRTILDPLASPQP
ncbi:MAG: SDR family oxidoreductase [Pseudomonadota bacterium]